MTCTYKRKSDADRYGAEGKEHEHLLVTLLEIISYAEATELAKDSNESAHRSLNILMSTREIGDQTLSKMRDQGCTYKQTNKQTNKQIDRQANRQTGSLEIESVH
jgi:uncharacterized protein YaaW (UPF0174 family)